MSKPTIPAIILTAGLIIAPNAMAADAPTMRPLATATLDTLAITDVQADVPGYTQSSFTYWNKQPQQRQKPNHDRQSKNGFAKQNARKSRTTPTHSNQSI